MSRTLALSSSSGKIFQSKPEESSSGLRLNIDYHGKTHPNTAVTHVLSPLGDWLIVSDSKGCLTYFHLTRNKFAVIVRGCRDVKCLALIPSTPDEVAVSLGNLTIQIYQVIGKLVSTLKGHKTPVGAMQACPSKKYLISCSSDTCIIWNSQNWNRERSLYANPSGFISAYVVECMLGTLDSDGTLMLWNLKNFESMGKLFANEPLTGASFAGIEKKAVAVGKSGDIVVWNIEKPQVEYRMKHVPVPKIVKWWKNEVIVVLGSDEKLYLTDLKGSKVIGEVKNEKFSQFQISSNGVLSGISKTGNVQVYDLNALLGTKPIKTISHEVLHTPHPPQPQTVSVKDAELKKLLSKYGEFPEKHRILIWKALLKLPLNQTHFENLLKKGQHSSIPYIQKQFPLKDPHLMQNFCKVMSALAYYCPILAETEFFPAIVFPFVKLAGEELIVAFELVVTLLFNWISGWWENFPHAPVKYLIQVEDIIKSEEPELISHLERLGISCSGYVWPILKYLFTQAMTKQEFCIVVDHLFCRYTRPEFLICVAAGYMIYFKSTLLALKNPQDIESFLVQQNAIQVIKVIKVSIKLLEKPLRMQCMVPLPDEYPIFSNYPDFALNLQVNVRERLMKQDEELQLKKKYIQDINKKFQKLEEDEAKFRREQETLIQIESERRKTQVLEEKIQVKEQQKLDQESRQLRLSQIHRMEETIERSLKSQENLRKKELESIEIELNSRAENEKYFAQAKHEEDHLSLLEFKAAQRMLELMRVKNAEESMRKLKIHAQHWEREQEQRERILKSQWSIENEQRRIDLEMMRETKLKELEMCSEFNNKRRMDVQQGLKAMERELRVIDLEKERKLRLLAEEELIRNEEYLAQLKVKQELIRENEERQFHIILQQEKAYKIQKNEELLRELQAEQAKQAAVLRGQREENEILERQLEQNAINDRILEMRKQSDQMAEAKEKALQETLLQIESERRNQSKIAKDLEYRQKELKERTAYQKVVRDNIDEALQREKESFFKFKQEIQNETSELEEERKKMHERKMNEILKQREEALAQITQPRVREEFNVKEMRNYSEEDEEPRFRSMVRTENSPGDVHSTGRNYRFQMNKLEEPEEVLEAQFVYKKDQNRSEEPGKGFEVEESSEDSYDSNIGLNVKTQKKNEENLFHLQKSRKFQEHEASPPQFHKYTDLKHQSFENSERKESSFSDYDKLGSSPESYSKPQPNENEFKLYKHEPKSMFSNELIRNTTPKEEMFDLKKITEFNKDWNPKQLEKKVQIHEEHSSHCSSSNDSRPIRRQWEENSCSKCSSSESSLSYHQIDPSKPDRFFISKTQKPDIAYSDNWEDKSESSYNSYECSSCVYSSSDHSSECSCNCSSEESSPAMMSGHYHYSSDEYSEDSYGRHSTQL